tara:strand:- start:51 stop:260 length:210 start_codon:yes stop_codon:yes gene_type:complete
LDDDDDDNDDNDECDDPQNRATKPARKIVGVGVRLARRRRRRLEKRRCFERTNKEEDEDVGEKNDDGRK